MVYIVREGFDVYRSNVNRWIPDLKGISKTFSENYFNLKKVAYEEYNTSFIRMLGATLLLAYNTHWLGHKLTFENEGTYYTLAVAVLTVLYFTIRFFKKRERRIARKKMD